MAAELQKGASPAQFKSEKLQMEPPRSYKVILLNDDYTTMEFVVDILMDIFHHPPEKAEAIMLSVHKSGRGVAGIYDKEVAETKVYQTVERARDAGFPLQCLMEPL